MSSAKPLIFISYAHLDEPEKPRGEEVAWLTFVMKFLHTAVKSGVTLGLRRAQWTDVTFCWHRQ